MALVHCMVSTRLDSTLLAFGTEWRFSTADNIGQIVPIHILFNVTHTSRHTQEHAQEQWRTWKGGMVFLMLLTTPQSLREAIADCRVVQNKTHF